MQIGKIILSIRRKKIINQEELASKLNISTDYLSQIENGLREPGTELLQAIATELDVPLSVILLQLFKEGSFPTVQGKQAFWDAKIVMDDLFEMFTAGTEQANRQQKIYQ